MTRGEIILILQGVGCEFMPCPGPHAPPADCLTCFVCDALYRLVHKKEPIEDVIESAEAEEIEWEAP